MLENSLGKRSTLPILNGKLRLGIKVLVTGANGLPVVNLIRELVQSGVEVKALIRPGANLKVLEDVEFDVYRGNILSFDDIYDALRNCDASTTSVLPVEFEFYKNVNVDSTKNFVQAFGAKAANALCM